MIVTPSWPGSADYNVDILGLSTHTEQEIEQEDSFINTTEHTDTSREVIVFGDH